ncbi:YcdB/YcdC domain-containing protein [Clostridium thailandense]|uniref:YcdB/YcdC domain-containing protein n=1 Tax=Clostridium thailandense TaxID=2794346 RepID=UPI003989933F
MTSKKTYSIILTALISLTLTSAVYAQDIIKTSSSNITTSISDYNSKISKDEAKNNAKNFLKNYFDITIDDSKYQVNVNFIPDYQSTNINKNYIWQISWSLHNEEKDVNINISLDYFTGKVISYDNMTSLHGQSTGISNITEDQAKEISKSFLTEVNPEEFSQCKLSSNNDMSYVWKGDPTSYNFNYYRTINNIPFMDNYLNTIVDGVTGKIRSYNFRWNQIQPPSQEVTISEEKASQIFKDNIDLELKYIPYRDEYKYDTENKTIKLAYVPDTSKGINVDAKEGKMLDYDNSNLSDRTVLDLNEDQKKLFLGSYKPSQKLNKELDSTSAEPIMKSIIKDIYGDNYDIESTNYQENRDVYGTSLTCWSGQFVKKISNSDFREEGQITIDSLTGQLLSISKFNPMDKLGLDNNNSKSKLTLEQAYDKSIEILKKYFPDKVKNINTKQTHIDYSLYYNNVPHLDTFYDFNFNRLINGICYPDNTINIDFNSITGDISNINSRWTQNLNVPSPSGIINKNDAQNIFFSTYKPQLQYALFNESKDPIKSDIGIKLIYSLLDGTQYKQLNGVEAFKGKFIDYNGRELDNNIEAFKEKIKGSPVEKELSILASLGVIDTKNFDLNKKITRTELIKTLVNAKGYKPYMLDSAPSLKMSYNGSKEDETYKYLQMAVSYGVLDNSGDFKGDELVTKEEMIKDIVKLLGYDKLAQAKGIFLLSYSDTSDISSDNLGYIAISKGLGLTNDTDNKFRPKDSVTISDLSVSIYKALNSLRTAGY